MRKTYSSGKISWTGWLSARAVARSLPNGFSMTIREFAARPVAPSMRTIPAAAAGGTER
jgi:hypothetical protein